MLKLSLHKFVATLAMIIGVTGPVLAQSLFDQVISVDRAAITRYEINQRIKEFQTMEPEINCFLVGGDGPAFASSLESGIFATSNLEAIGLFAQWKYEQTK